jgi:hypothetical protein
MIVAILNDCRPAIGQQDQNLSPLIHFKLNHSDGVIIEEGYPIPNAPDLQQGITLCIS